MLVITGLGRCGVSLIGQVLLSMNYKGGNDLKNYRLPSITQLNKDIYHQILLRGSVDLDSRCRTEYWINHTYRSAIATATKDPRQRPVHFIIEPCFMWHKEILKTWIRVRNDLRFLVVKRKFEDIALSYVRNPPEKNEMFFGYDPTRYEKALEDCITTLKDFDIKHHVSIYPKFLINAGTMFKAVRLMSHLQFCHVEANRIMQEILED